MSHGADQSRLPLVTIAMPVFNAGEFLRMAVKSIVMQTFREWELLILDDGSTDNALATIEDIIADPRITVVRDGQNRGLAARLNEAIHKARGNFFARMDQDDAAYPERIALQIALLHREPALDLVATRAIIIDTNNEAIGEFPFAGEHQSITARPWQGFHFPHPTWMGHLSWFKRNLYAQPAPYFCEDQELLLRTYGSSRLGMVNNTAFAYRVRNRFSPSRQLKTRHTLWKLQCQHFLARKQLVPAMLGTGVFAARILGDCFRVATWKLPYRPRASLANRELAKQWESVRARLLENYGAP